MFGSLITGMLATGTAVACAVPLLIAATTAGDQTQPSEDARHQIPAPLLTAYQQAPACRGLPWQIVAAIGWVESRHGTIHGARLDPATGEVAPHIVGVALDGNRTAAIPAPAAGSPWHDDATWDHAVGPMQFITTTWQQWAVDASGDDHASPHNAFDAIATAGRYLCDHRKELTHADAVNDAVRRYNNSATYVKAVMDKAYRYGMTDGGDPVADSTHVPRPGAGPAIRGDAARVVTYARAQLGDPYVWGAEGPDAFDCSGLTLAAARTIGIRLPHKSALQVRYGTPVDRRHQRIKPGDLIFLRGGKPVHDYGHVGIATSHKTWINAPRTGRTVTEDDIPFSRVQAVRRLIL